MSWTTPATYSAEQILSKTDLDEIVDNLEFLNNTGINDVNLEDGAGDLTTNSTTFTSVGSLFSSSLTTKSGYALVMARWTGRSNVTAGINYFDISVGGTRIGGADGLLQFPWNSVADFRGELFTVVPVPTGLTTVELVWKTNDAANQGQIQNTIHGLFWLVRQISFTP